MKTGSLISLSAAQTQQFAHQLAGSLKGGEIIFLRGPIGAGKTIFVKGIADALHLKTSPTSASFSLMKAYHNKHVRLFHIDLFRLEENEVFNLGLEEILEDEKAILLAEWPDPAAQLFPQDRLELTFVLCEGDKREIQIRSFGRQSDRLWETLCKK